jgi:hypothetical protein
MGVGKYSPTVSDSYALDQDWWKRNGGGYENGLDPKSENDNDGFDSYGYKDGDGPDRAGNTEFNYMVGEFHGEEYTYDLYDSVSDEWRGRLLGDLNDYIKAADIVFGLSITLRDFIRVAEFIIKPSDRMIGKVSWSMIRIHKDDFPKVKERFLALKR